MVIFLFTVALSSCQKELKYSCDPKANTWVEENLPELKTMSRSAWLGLEVNELTKRAAYGAFNSNAKKSFWMDRVSEVINQFDWNEKELQHLSSLLDYLNNTNVFNIRGVNDNFELFMYSWNEYAMEELQWSRKLLYGITANANVLQNKQGDMIMSSSVTKADDSHPGGGGGALRNCSCSQESDWCDIFGEIPSWVVSCNDIDYDCSEVEQECGTFWEFNCNGVCKAPIAK